MACLVCGATRRSVGGPFYTSGVAFHCFPRNKQRSQEWLQHIGKPLNTVVIHQDCVCSRHFRDDDYNTLPELTPDTDLACVGKVPKVPTLKKSANPTLDEIFDRTRSVPKKATIGQTSRNAESSTSDCEMDGLDFDIELEVTEILLKKMNSNLTRALKRHKNLILKERASPKNPKQKATETKNDVESKVTNDSDILFCENCQHYYQGNCPIHVENIDISAPIRAISTIPRHLELGTSFIPGMGRGIFAVKLIEKDTLFGPYEGVLTPKPKNEMKGFAWQQIMKDGKNPQYIDGMDTSKSNWMRYINCARVESQQNLVAFHYQGQIFYQTFKDIHPGEELLVWYGDSYATELGISAVKDTFNQPSTSRCTNYVSIVPKTTVDKDEDKLRKITSACSYDSDLSFQLKRHMLKRNGELPYKCDQCEESFEWTSSLIKHTRIHTGERPYTCEQCGYSFKQKSTLITHLHSHIPERPYKCDQCGHSFTTVLSLIAHKRTHNLNRPFKCNQYGVSFTNESNFITRKRKHNGERPFKCDQCELSFKQKSSLIIHTRGHTRKRPFKCDHCGHSFTQKSSLIIHARMHTGERPFKCDHCGHSFTVKSSLTKHKYIHSGEKPFKCDECGLNFTQRTSLISHKRRHTGERPYKCDQCNHSFIKRSSLNKHSCTYGLRPYKCEECGHSFSGKVRLINHKRKHIGQRPMI